jgi:hypothetical protein
MRQIGVKMLLTSIDVRTQPGWRDIMATQYSSPPERQLLMKRFVKLLRKKVIRRSAKQPVLIGHMPKVPTKAPGVCAPGISQNFFDMAPEPPCFRIKLILNKKPLGLNVHGISLVV